MKKDLLLYVVLPIAGIALAVIIGQHLYLYITAPSYADARGPAIDPAADPIQIDLAGAENIAITFKSGQGVIQPQAKYKIAAKVISKAKYHSVGENASKEFAPYDFLLAWGKTATTDLKGKVKFRHGNRWYEYWVKPDSPLSAEYIGQHSSNHHLFYASDDLKRAAARLKKGDLIELTGYLINFSGTAGGRTMQWNSSLSRTDTGGGACEIVYVVSLRKNDKLYGKPLDL